MQVHHKMFPHQLTSPVAEQQRREDISLLSTIIQPLEAPGKALAPVRLRLPLDGMGRPYLVVNNPYEETFPLIKAALERFHQIEHCYPSVIVLSALRRLSILHFDNYYVEHGAIPYTCNINATWDLCLRGECRQ